MTEYVNLKVTNKNDFTIHDRFDGVPYDFEPGKPLVIPADAAQHILGWLPGIETEAVRKYVEKRWGWNTPEMQANGNAKKFFANLEFAPVRYRLIEVVESEEVADPPAEAPPLAENERGPKPAKGARTSAAA